ncbi:MAG: hypothetical protein RRY97_10035, partial [Oscillibacter sp.]
MLRLKANKTSLYKLVAAYVPMPIMKWARFRKVPRSPDYFLDWHQENGYAQAFFSTCMGRPMLSVTVRDIDGHQVSRDVFRPTLA